MKKLFIITLLAFIFVSFNASAALNTSLEAYWIFNESTGTQVLDNQKAAHNFTLSNMENGDWLPGFFNNGLRFTDVGADNEKGTTAGDITPYGNLTVALWYNSTTNSGSERLIVRGNDDGYGWNLWSTGGQLVWIVEQNSTINARKTDSNLLSNTWYHIIATYNNDTKEIELYVNGTKQTTYSADNTLHPGTNITIGAAPDVVDKDLEGMLDEIGIWSKVLDTEEIDELYNNGLGKQFDALGSQASQFTVTLNVPEDNSVESTDTITFNATSEITNGNLTNATYFVWFANGTLFNQTTVNINGTVNVTSLDISNFILSGYDWNVESCGTNSTGVQCGRAGSNFSFAWRPFSEHNQSFEATVFDTDYQEFVAVVNSTNTVPLISAILVYDDTTFSSTFTENDDDQFTFRSFVSIPVVSSQENKTFHWEFTIVDDDGNEFFSNSTTNNQTINPSLIDSCGSPTLAINYSLRNETSQSLISGDLDATFEWRLNPLSTVKKTANFSLTGNSHEFCINTNQTFYSNVDMRADATGFKERTFQFDNQEFTNVTTIRPLYLLSTTLGTDVIIKLKDVGLFPLANHTIKIFRNLESGGSILVENDVTDDIGQIVARLVENDVKYTIQFFNEEGTLVKTVQNAIVACTTTICQQIFIVQSLTDAFNDFDDLTEHTSSLTFNNNTRTFNFAWSDNRGEDQTHRLLVEKITFINGTEVVSNQTSLSDSAVLSYIADDSRAAYRVSAFRSVGEDEDRLHVINVEIGSNTQIFKFEGLYWSFIIFMLMLLVGRFYPPAGVILYLFTVFMLGIFDIIFINPAIIIAQLVVGVLFIWAFRG